MIIRHLITVYMMRIKLGIKRQLDLQHRIVTVDELAAAQKIPQESPADGPSVGCELSLYAKPKINHPNEYPNVQFVCC